MSAADCVVYTTRLSSIARNLQSLPKLNRWLPNFISKDHFQRLQFCSRRAGSDKLTVFQSNRTFVLALVVREFCYFAGSRWNLNWLRLCCHVCTFLQNTQTSSEVPIMPEFLNGRPGLLNNLFSFCHTYETKRLRRLDSTSTVLASGVLHTGE